MHEVTRSAIVPYSASKMYTLVNDIACYPDFLPWCRSVEILEIQMESMLASLMITKPPFNQQLTTRNTLQENTRIEMRQQTGPFSCFEADWQFENLSADACQVHFCTCFKFKSKMLDLAMSSYFSQVANAMLDAFVARAKQVYTDG